MARAASYILIFITGLAAGVLMSNAGERGTCPDAATASVDVRYQRPEKPPESSLSQQPATVYDPLDETASDTMAEIVPSGLPDIYREMIGPAGRSPTFAQLHEMFESEPRDEPWAASMEAGLRAYLDRYTAKYGLVIEFVECRSQHCEIAGYVVGGLTSRSYDLFEGVKHEGWWDAGSWLPNLGQGSDGIDHFVQFVVRYDPHQLD